MDANFNVPAADATADPAAFMRWDEQFWNEPEEAGRDLIRARLLMEGQINTLEGHYENGKTAVMIDVARQWAELGRPVLYLDYEMGMRRVRRRMKANLWHADLLPLWHYLYMPNPEPGLLAKLMGVVPEKPMIAVDSYSQAMMYLSRDENSATEAGSWWVTELQGARDNFGATIVVIDQVTKGATSNDRYAGRGTGAKSFGTDVKWFVERYERFSPTQIGLVKLTRLKDREGVLPEELAFHVGDGQGNLILTPTEPPAGPPIDEQLVRDALAVLRSEGWQTKDSLKAKLGVGYPKAAVVLDHLVKTAQAVQRERVGRGGGTEYGLPTGATTTHTMPGLD